MSREAADAVALVTGTNAYSSWVEIQVGRFCMWDLFGPLEHICLAISHHWNLLCWSPTCWVEIQVSCKNLRTADTFSKSDPMVALFQQQTSGWREIARTEVISNNESPVFAKVKNTMHNVFHGA